MRGVGGEAGGALEFLAGLSKGGFGAVTLREIFGGIDFAFFDRLGEATGENVTGDHAGKE